MTASSNLWLHISIFNHKTPSLLHKSCLMSKKPFPYTANWSFGQSHNLISTLFLQTFMYEKAVGTGTFTWLSSNWFPLQQEWSLYVLSFHSTQSIILETDNYCCASYPFLPSPYSNLLLWWQNTSYAANQSFSLCLSALCS